MRKRNRVRRLLSVLLVLMLLCTTAFSYIVAGSAETEESVNMTPVDIFSSGPTEITDADNGMAEMFGDGSDMNISSESIAVFSDSLAQAESFTLAGNITYVNDVAAEIPVAVPNIHVYVVDMTTGNYVKDMKTGTDGKFLFEKLSMGTYRLEYVDENEIFEPEEFIWEEVYTENGYKVNRAEERGSYFAYAEAIQLNESKELNLRLVKEAEISEKESVGTETAENEITDTEKSEPKLSESEHEEESKENESEKELFPVDDNSEEGEEAIAEEEGNPEEGEETAFEEENLEELEEIIVEGDGEIAEIIELNGDLTADQADSTEEAEQIQEEIVEEEILEEEILEEEFAEEIVVEEEFSEEQDGEPEEALVMDIADVTEFKEKVLTYTDEKVEIAVTELEAGAIPDDVTLKVVPITDEAETEEEYREVEAQLKEKAEGEDYEIAGFLIYDITFIDENGVEQEPNGQVQVTMNYVEAAVPEDVAEKIAAKEISAETEVTVMHLEENSQGEVTEVVDMNEENQLIHIETTEEKEVQTAQFATESFSKFVITWVDVNSENTVSMDAYCVDENGNPITVYELDAEGNYVRDENGKPKEIPVVREISFSKYEGNSAAVILANQNLDLENYVYAGAYVVNSDGGGRADIDAVLYSNSESTWYYRVWVGNTSDWHTFTDTMTLYLKYKEAELNVTKVPTVDSSKRGINISLFNYDGDINSSGSPFQFVGSTYGINGSIAGTVGTGISADGYKPGLVKNNLSNGYPVLTNNRWGNGNNTSLAYLFNSGTTGVSEAYTNLDGLFRLNEDGYYEYNSQNNHAQLNVEKNRIDVYNAKLAPASYTYGNFLPFNQLPASAVEGGLYNLEATAYMVDYWFGMNVDMSFAQPTGGKINGQDMTFFFQGDDDMWVYIDGKLVLDIGGMHGYISGTINFATGEVTITTPNGNPSHTNTSNPNTEDGRTPVTYIGEMYKKAYEEAYKEACSVDKLTAEQNAEITGLLDGMFLKNAEGKYTTFQNFSEHTMKIFYFERGSAASNCWMKFNIPTLRQDEITIRKEITNYDEGVNSDVDFVFELYAKTPDQGETITEKIATVTAERNIVYIEKSGWNDRRMCYR